MRAETVPSDLRGVERKGDLLTWGDCAVCADGEGIEIYCRPRSLRSLHFLVSRLPLSAQSAGCGCRPPVDAVLSL
jgi:hypothetical protein